MLARLEARSRSSFASMSSMGFYICTGLMNERRPKRARCNGRRKKLCGIVAALYERRRHSACFPSGRVGGHRLPLQFELMARYVSLSTMSRERRRGVGCRAQSKEKEGPTHVLDEIGTLTTAEPT